MKVLFWVPYPSEGASNRYRVEQYLPYLKANGIKYALRPFWSSYAYKVLYKRGYYFRKAFFFILGILSRIYDIIRIAQFDIVFIHRESCPINGPFLETILSKLHKPIIFDFDDAIFLPSSSRTNSFIERLKRPEKTAKIITMSKQIIAGNRYLADFALKFNKNVQIIPTSIDTDKFYPKIKKRREKIVIGWMGSFTTVDFIKEKEGIFIELSKRFSDVIFKIIGGDFRIEGLTNIISKPWSLDEEIEDLESFDIGIMPIPDNEWTKGKCGFKAILCMSKGIPCVCSPVGVNKEIIIDGKNGFLAVTKEDWIKKLSLLVENEELSRRIGADGRLTVEEKFSLKVNAPKLFEVLMKGLQ
jgi:glycosyltransferase involved in cell wall biosynthesis